MKIIHADCLEVMRYIDGNSIDMILADPPYEITACNWDSIIPLVEMWRQLKNIIKPNGVIVMTAVQPFTTMLIASNMDMFKYCWVWEKTAATGHLNAKKMPLRAHEDIVVFYNSPPRFNPQKTYGHEPINSYVKNSGDGECYGKTKIGISGGGSRERYPRSVQLFSRDTQKNCLHPTQKPLALMEYLIKTYTNEGDTVLDFAMGSGTTGAAAKGLGRDFIGIECDEKYFNIAKTRINETIYQESLF